MEQTTYHLRKATWPVLISWGILCIGTGVCILILLRPINNAQNLFGDIALMLFALPFILFGLLPFGILFSTKLILSSDGIEFHSHLAIFKSRWLGVRARIPRGGSPKIITLHLPDPEITLRPWTRFLPWRSREAVAKNLDRDGVLISDFVGNNGQRAAVDIQHFINNMEEYGNLP